MSLWAKAQMLPHDALQKVRDIYGDHFPIEVRHCLAYWIERKVMNEVSEEQQRFFVEEFCQEIKTHAKQLSLEMFVSMMKLINAASNFHSQYSHAPHELYKYIQRCLQRELEIINSIMTNAYPGHAPPTERKYSELITGLHTVRVKVNQAREEIRVLQANIDSFLKLRTQPNFIQQSGQVTNEQGACLRMYIEAVENQLNMMKQIKQSHIFLVNRLKGNVNHLRELQGLSTGLQDFNESNRQLQLSENGVPMHSNLNTIQDWCNSLAELIWIIRDQVNIVEFMSKSMPELEEPHQLDGFDDIRKSLTSLLPTLGTSTLVIRETATTNHED